MFCLVIIIKANLFFFLFPDARPMLLLQPEGPSLGLNWNTQLFFGSPKTPSREHYSPGFAGNIHIARQWEWVTQRFVIWTPAGRESLFTSRTGNESQISFFLSYSLFLCLYSPSVFLLCPLSLAMSLSLVFPLFLSSPSLYPSVLLIWLLSWVSANAGGWGLALMQLSHCCWKRQRLIQRPLSLSAPYSKYFCLGGRTWGHDEGCGALRFMLHVPCAHNQKAPSHAYAYLLLWFFRMLKKVLWLRKNLLSLSQG